MSVPTLCQLCDGSTRDPPAAAASRPRRGSIASVLLRVDADRLRADFDALAAIGATPDGGRRARPSRRAHLAARAWFHERAAPRARDEDRRRRQPLRRPARPRPRGAHAPARLAPRFRSARRPVRRRPRRRLRARGASCRAGRGARAPGHARGCRLHRRGGDADRHVRQPRARGGCSPRGSRGAARRPRAPRRGARAHGAQRGRHPRRAPRPGPLAGYLELHIEQGPVLERAGIDIGIVTGIVGTASFKVVFEGEARHAGTTPMGARRDAAVGAAAFVLGVREIVSSRLPRGRRHGR